MKRTLRLLCLLLACLTVTASLAACDLSDVLDGLDGLDSSSASDGTAETVEGVPADTYLQNGDPDWETELATESENLPTGYETDIAYPDIETEPDTDPAFTPEDALNALESVNWGGDDFTVLCNSTIKSELYTDSIGSSTVSDAVYERNILLEEVCNLRFKTLELTTDQGLTDTLRNEVMTASGDFQLIDHYAGYAVSNASSGYLSSFGSLGREDLSGPWWDQGNAACLLFGRIYFMSGSANTLDDDVTYVMYFNTKLRNDLKIEDPYQTVLDGKWTLDYFAGLVQSAVCENGDGQWDEEDTYGFTANYDYANAFFIGSDLRYSQSDSDGGMTVTVGSYREKILTAGDVLGSFYSPNKGGFIAAAGESDKAAVQFKTGRCLFYGDVLGSRNDTEEEYGILPVPKFNLDQAEYRSWAHPSAPVLSAPVTLGDGDEAATVGRILEAFAILSHATVRDAYSENVLKTRREQDPVAFDVLDTVLDNRVWELAFLMGDSVCESAFENGVSNGSVGNQITRAEKTLERELQKLSYKFADLYS